MAKEITLVIRPENSSLEMTPARCEAWHRLKLQILEIIAKAGIVEIPEQSVSTPLAARSRGVRGDSAIRCVPLSAVGCDWALRLGHEPR